MPARKPSGHFCLCRWLSTPLSKLLNLQLLGSSYLKQNLNSLKYTEIIDQISEGFCFKMKQKCSHFLTLSTSTLPKTPDLCWQDSPTLQQEIGVIPACQPVCLTDRWKATKTKQLFEAQIFLFLWLSVPFPSITPSSYDPLKPIS